MEDRIERLGKEQYLYYREHIGKEQPMVAENKSSYGEGGRGQLPTAELEQIQKMSCAGVRVMVDGVRVPPEQIAEISRQLAQASYMRDYVADSNGIIVELRFDRLA